MDFLPLALPPGVYRNGTKTQAKGRWYAANGVRWFEGTMRPIGGWQAVPVTSPGPTADLVVSGIARSILGWRSATGAAQLAIGTNTHAYGFSEGALTDITPVDLTTGGVDTVTSVGAYGAGLYGALNYGVGDPAQGTETDAATWQLDNWGDWLVGVLTSDGRVLGWDRNVANKLTAVDVAAPTNCSGVVVTPERFLFALGADGDARKIAWPSQETLDDWTPSDTNTAGDFTLEGPGRIRCGRRGRGETLIWTDTDLYVARYIGGTFVYSFERVGTNCGIIAPNAVAVMDGTAAWMSSHGFFIYDGYVRPVSCEVFDHVFGDFNFTQRAKCWAQPVAQYGEVWFFYPSAGSSECDRYVIWNFRENHFSTGELARTAGVDQGAFPYPMMVGADSTLYDHERGNVRTGLTASAESGPVELGNGERVIHLQRIVPDEKTLGDVEATIFGAMHPTATEAEYGPYTMAEPTDVRITARQVRLKLTETRATDWRVGVIKFGGKQGGTR